MRKRKQINHVVKQINENDNDLTQNVERLLIRCKTILCIYPRYSDLVADICAMLERFQRAGKRQRNLARCFNATVTTSDEELDCE